MSWHLGLHSPQSIQPHVRVPKHRRCNYEPWIRSIGALVDWQLPLVPGWPSRVCRPLNHTFCNNLRTIHSIGCRSSIAHWTPRHMRSTSSRNRSPSASENRKAYSRRLSSLPQAVGPIYDELGGRITHEPVRLFMGNYGGELLHSWLRIQSSVQRQPTRPQHAEQLLYRPPRRRIAWIVCLRFVAVIEYL